MSLYPDASLERFSTATPIQSAQCYCIMGLRVLFFLGPKIKDNLTTTCVLFCVSNRKLAAAAMPPACSMPIFPSTLRASPNLVLELDSHGRFSKLPMCRDSHNSLNVPVACWGPWHPRFGENPIHNSRSSKLGKTDLRSMMRGPEFAMLGGQRQRQSNF